MAALGQYALALALIAAVYMALGGWRANRKHSPRFHESVRGAAIAVALAMTTAVFVLEYLLLTGDYQIQAVYNHSDRALPLMYKMGALWGGDSGSVLFWGWILALYAAFVAWRGWPREGRMTPMVVPLLGAVLVFFSGMSNVVVNPFRIVSGHPANGAGLDPLLQNVVMTIHPPAMYTGLIGMVVPAAYIVAAVWTRVPWREWVPIVRRWMLFSWMLLGVALILGGMWAYMELGWGGYWEWDPVENAALLPWLTATAFLHALQLEEKRGLYRWWTASLGTGTFLLTLIGTYITRSGVLKNSVHSFTGTGVGPYFVALFWVSAVFIAGVFWLRRDMLVDRMALAGTFSKESIYLLLNVSLSTLAAIVLIGTFYPVISKAFWGQTIVLNESFFNATAAPLFLLLAGLMGLAPVVGWRQPRYGAVLRKLRVPLLLAVSASAFAVWRGYRAFWPTLGVGIAAFAASSMLQEYYRAARVQRMAHGTGWGSALIRVLATNRRRYGGYLAHLAFVTVMFGVIGSHTNAVSLTETLAPGQSVAVRGYHVTYEGLRNHVHTGYVTTAAKLLESRGPQRWTAEPGLSFFPGSAQPVADVSIRAGWLQDLYVVLEGSPGQGRALLEIMVNPLVSWIWLGMIVLAAGTVLAMSAPHGRDAAPGRPSEFDAEPGRLWRDVGAVVEGRDPI